MQAPDREWRAGQGLRRFHRFGARNREIHQNRTGEIEGREDVEIRCQAEMVGHRGRDQSADQIARDVAGDVGRECASRVLGTARLAEIRERECERGRHEHALSDAQQSEAREIGCGGKQRGRNREQRQAEQDAEPPVDAAAEERDGEAGNRHPERAGVDREGHRGRRDVVGLGQRGKNGLGGEQVDDREECGHADHERTAHDVRSLRTRGHVGQGCARELCHFVAPVAWLGVTPAEKASPRACGDHMFLSDLSCRMSAESSTTVLSPVFFHQCEVACVSRATSPALCTIGTEHVLAYSRISPSTM